MSDCECGAHWMQNCDWWCGQNLTSKEIWEKENPVAAEVKKLKEQVEDLKNIITDQKQQEKGYCPNCRHSFVNDECACSATMEDKEQGE